MKTAGTPVTHADGTVTNTWTVTATNTGNEPLANLDITDDLTAAGVPTGYTITNHTATPPFTPNPTFDGDTDTHLITPAPLPIDATITITFELTYTPTTDTGIANTATGTATGTLTDTPVTDTDGPITPPNPTFTPELSLLKAATDPIDHGDGRFTNTWTVTATNTGNEPLANLDITDDLTAAGVPTGYTITNHTATPPFTPNPTFDGDTDTHLITPAPLPIDATITITFEVTFTPTLGATISNLAEANTTGGLTDTPVSTQSAPPGTPYEPGDPTTVGPITATHGPAFSVKKQTCVLDPCDPTNDTHWGDQNTALTGTSADWRIVVTNTGDTELTDVEIDDPTVPACSADITSLPIAKSATTTCSSTAITGSVTNTVNVNAQTPYRTALAKVASATVARVDPPARRPANSSAAGAILAFTGGAQGLLAAVGMALLAAGLALLTLRRRHARSR